MNYTNNHHLPQWEKSDRVLMEDFNQAMSDIETGIDAAIQHGADAASQAQSAASALAAKAQATADSAVSKADNAQATANYAFSPSKLPYKAGTYLGNGGTQEINVGFQPSFVIISNQSVSTSNEVADAALAGLNGKLDNYVKFTSTGFTVRDTGSYAYPKTNQGNVVYNYIAFR